MSDPSDNRFYREPEPVETRTVHVHLADATRTEPVPPVVIRVDQPLPKTDPERIALIAEMRAYQHAARLAAGKPREVSNAAV